MIRCFLNNQEHESGRDVRKWTLLAWHAPSVIACFILPAQSNVEITPIKHGVDFLHCRYKFGRTGKIIKSGGRESVKRERRKLKKFRKKLDEGELDRKQIAEFYSSWRGFMQYFDSKTLLKNTDKLYNKLFIEG